MPAIRSSPPTLPVDALTFQAKLDYVTLAPFRAKTRLPQLTGSHEDVRASHNTGRTRALTVHDPVKSDIVALSMVMDSALVVGLEVAVDLRVKFQGDAVHARQTLEQTFLAVAARFRPEDQALWDHASRGAVSRRGGPIDALERRHARLGEEVIYGGKGEWMQAKIYMKTLDQGSELPTEEHSVRMEITLRRWACERLGIDNVVDLIGYPFRRRFATQFRIIDRPELRAAARLSPSERDKRTKRMTRAWNTAGVGKFAVGDRPREDLLLPAQKRLKARARAQLPADEYKLVRDQRANAKIGSALMNLQRRMAG